MELVVTIALIMLPSQAKSTNCSIISEEVKWATIGGGGMLLLVVVISLLVMMVVCVCRHKHPRSEVSPNTNRQPESSLQARRQITSDHVYEPFPPTHNTNKGRTLPPEPQDLYENSSFD